MESILSRGTPADELRAARGTLAEELRAAVADERANGTAASSETRPWETATCPLRPMSLWSWSWRSPRLG